MALQPITLRMRQRRRQRLLILAAAFLLLIAGAAYYWYAGTRSEPPRREQQPPGTVSVPVAATNLPLGEMIRPQALRNRYLQPAQVPADAILRASQLAGRVVVRRVPAGAYFRQDDLAPLGAPASLSGLAKPGMRIVVVEADQISAVPGYIRPGDRVDVLAISFGAAVNPAALRANRLASSPNTVEGGGSQPGDPNAASRRTARGQLGMMGMELPMVAKLVGEDAEVLQAPATPPAQANPRVRRAGERYLVLQMKPDDAHITTLSLASGHSLRLVFRPFNERERVRVEQPIDEFTHVSVDARRVEVINGVNRRFELTTLD
ncbi:MAG: Flp pilus assembly protein CpaB [Burkholderiales bacterium]|nr:Flp pilus assembly protein CpaB [Burkholderiales bacterium]